MAHARSPSTSLRANACAIMLLAALTGCSKPRARPEPLPPLPKAASESPVAVAQAEFDRRTALAKEGLVPADQVDEAEVAWRMAEAEAAAAAGNPSAELAALKRAGEAQRARFLRAKEGLEVGTATAGDVVDVEAVLETLQQRLEGLLNSSP